MKNEFPAANGHQLVTIVAIDPGPQESAWVQYDIRGGIPSREFGKQPNAEVRELVRSLDNTHRLVVEMVAYYGTGRAVGRTVFDTCVWIGRFLEAWDSTHGTPGATMLRKTVVTHACGTPAVGDSNVRQAMIDRWEPDLEPRCRPKGVLKDMKADMFQALALAAAYAELRLAAGKDA